MATGAAGESIAMEAVTEQRSNCEGGEEALSVQEERRGPLGLACAPVRGLLSASKPRRTRWCFRLLYGAVATSAIAAIASATGKVAVTQSGLSVARAAWLAGGLCTAASVLISFFGILLHLDAYSNPRLQRWVVRVLWMVPVYSLCSFASLSLYLEPLCSKYKLHNKYLVFDTVRDFYEAFTIFCFLRLCLEWLEEAIPSGDAVFHIAQRPAKKFMPPYSHGQPVGTGFLNFCRTGTMDYVVVQAISSTITLVAVLASPRDGAYGVFGQGELFNFKTFYPYIVIVKSCAQAWAIWCLTLLYRMTVEDLEPLKPLGKFLCIKLIVFFTFWQSVMWSLFVALGIITDGEGCSESSGNGNAPPATPHSAEQLSLSRQGGRTTVVRMLTSASTLGGSLLDSSNSSNDVMNVSDCAHCAKDRVAVYDHLLICFEMLGFAIAHLKTFPWSDFKNDTLAQLRSGGGMRSGVRAMFDVSDVYEEMRARVGQYRMLGVDTFFGRNSRSGYRPQRNPTEPLLSPDFPSDDL